MHHCTMNDMKKNKCQYNETISMQSWCCLARIACSLVFVLVAESGV